MLQPLETLLRVCWFRAGPQDLPYSREWLILLVVAATALSVVSLQLLPEEDNGFGRVLLHTALGLGVPWILLQLRGRLNRYVQTASAMFGTSLLLTLFVLPPLFALGGSPGEPVVWAAYWWLAVVIWSVAVMGHIMRHALDLPLSAGVVIALLYYGLSLFLNQFVG
ncbi:peptidoglycan/LPS O-acetylase OafA/YrhL [Natronocella acetinitrilica]|uniref:Peptidoglycan/LPS O-acetylase OafA/YrhL n=1 Tax=Natronocella acetinitrilica TaxID=414046 RepID=A0AAE3KB35_9GAMM|nr:hypothetical protein [Natronocella acetinitrilica]MCP1675095.1 peptidoglycan/LPS O-acetylase OafA/YrhL [Natronocella acetinitrilica]